MTAAIQVMHMIDTLAIGGAEQMAVNLVNGLQGQGVTTHLCTTRFGGPLEQQVDPTVSRLSLNRQARIDLSALKTLRAYLRNHTITVVHAHSTSLFTAVLASVGIPNLHVIWHDHTGQAGLARRRSHLYRVMVKRTSAIIAVNRDAADWSRAVLTYPPERIHLVANFIPDRSAVDAAPLPGTAGKRVIAVANLRPEKDQEMLVNAWPAVLRDEPEATLLLVGGGDEAYGDQVRARIAQLNLENAVHCLGPRDDVPQLLKACDLGALGSRSEGLPLALLEYGQAGLAVVATDVGDCRTVIGDDGGVIVAPEDCDGMATAIVQLLGDANRRQALGLALKDRIHRDYSSRAALTRIQGIYRDCFSCGKGAA